MATSKSLSIKVSAPRCRINAMKTTVEPWGKQILWADPLVNLLYAGKILHIYKGHRLSLQFHRQKTETIYVLSGTLTIQLKVGRKTVKEGQAYHIPNGTTHRFCAEQGDVILVEVSSPEIDDIVRLEDDYGRDR
jgi:mannose-6-phosphate isomerase-like protein (cupin superfamily)